MPSSLKLRAGVYLCVLVALAAVAALALRDARQEGEAIGAGRATKRERERVVRVIDSLSQRLAEKEPPLVRILHKTDTLIKSYPETLHTAKDTADLLAGWPVLRASTDSAIRACSEYQIECSRFRVVSDSLRREDGRRIDSLLSITVKPRRSWVGPAFIAGALAGGYLVSRVR